MHEIKANNWDKVYKNGGLSEYYNMESQHPDLFLVMNYFKDKGVSKVLDVGCGRGGNLIALANKGFEVFGIDMSAKAINDLKSSLDRSCIKSEVKKAVFQDIPYNDNSFDAVVSIQTLTHGYAEDIKKGISEITRVTKPGGVIFITLPGRFAFGKERYSLIKTADRQSERVYMPMKGKEIGIPHFIFNEKLIKNYFSNFKIKTIWKDYLDYYAFLGIKK